MADECPRTKRAFGAPLSATLLAAGASQHHLLHLLLLTVGVGGTGVGFMTLYPAVRRAMLLLSVVLLGVSLVRAARRPPSAVGRLLLGASLVATLGLVAWSVAQFGW